MTLALTTSNLSRHNAFWRIIPRVVYKKANLTGLQKTWITGLQYCLQVTAGNRLHIQPQVIIFGLQDHRHPVMNGLHAFIGLCGDDGAGGDFLPYGIGPDIVQASHTKGYFILHADEEGLLA